MTDDLDVAAPSRLGLGIALDLPWGKPIGFDPATGGPTAKVETFLRRQAHQFAYLVFSFQPRGLAPPVAGDYVEPYRRLVACVPDDLPLAFHQTTLNLGAVDHYDRGRVYELTNRLGTEFGFRWVVEDLGIWSLRGVPLPYPLPPYFTYEGLSQVVENVRAAKAALDPRLHVEFPGFTDKVTVAVGTELDAYRYFRLLADGADVAVTLDVGHLLSYRWTLGHRGEDLYADLDELPLDRCNELHLSGCTIHGDRFFDPHHGVLLDEQIELCELLLQRCPNLTAVTYEDPKFDAEGQLIRKSLHNFERLRDAVSSWSQA